MEPELGKKIILHTLLEENGFVDDCSLGNISLLSGFYGKLCFNKQSPAITLQNLTITAKAVSGYEIYFCIFAEGRTRTNLKFEFRFPKQESGMRKFFNLFIRYIPVYTNLFAVTCILKNKGIRYRENTEFKISQNLSSTYMQIKDRAGRFNRDCSFSLYLDDPERNFIEIGDRNYSLYDLSDFTEKVYLPTI